MPGKGKPFLRFPVSVSQDRFGDPICCGQKGEERNEESATVPRWKTPETVPITGDCKRTDGEHGPYCRISSMCNPCVGNVNISENSEKNLSKLLKTVVSCFSLTYFW